MSVTREGHPICRSFFANRTFFLSFSCGFNKRAKIKQPEGSLESAVQFFFPLNEKRQTVARQPSSSGAVIAACLDELVVALNQNKKGSSGERIFANVIEIVPARVTANRAGLVMRRYHGRLTVAHRKSATRVRATRKTR